MQQHMQQHMQHAKHASTFRLSFLLAIACVRSCARINPPTSSTRTCLSKRRNTDNSYPCAQRIAGVIPTTNNKETSCGRLRDWISIYIVNVIIDI
jgi:hypothetical protein